MIERIPEPHHRIPIVTPETTSPEEAGYELTAQYAGAGRGNDDASGEVGAGGTEIATLTGDEEDLEEEEI